MLVELHLDYGIKTMVHCRESFVHLLFQTTDPVAKFRTNVLTLLFDEPRKSVEVIFFSLGHEENIPRSAKLASNGAKHTWQRPIPWAGFTFILELFWLFPQAELSAFHDR